MKCSYFLSIEWSYSCTFDQPHLFYFHSLLSTSTRHPILIFVMALTHSTRSQILFFIDCVEQIRIQKRPLAHANPTALSVSTRAHRITSDEIQNLEYSSILPLIFYQKKKNGNPNGSFFLGRVTSTRQYETLKTTTPQALCFLSCVAFMLTLTGWMPKKRESPDGSHFPQKRPSKSK